ncbi:tRNA (adenosine(37)-N6)-dimethylallyltransferase MiaA [Cohnella endophytica]|uniref:tRNA dimethylallyltransferase n=1 Tax=Cohnella endophytica TaxID=2419778 RepID=A0A494Y5Z9_9BACL|nr:tRNA (adenosine(37)-N6)-dimethylallyltransferase MiaA [Cohnella endophytica]RKP56945.1 tRNA (adenosine(37)-N6)-dimethylallyltransferase MiaA [Cohnella endophytica]
MNDDTIDNRPPLLVLVGPTAVGKTALSLRLAKALNAEIISGDSMQVYRRMDIGTAKLMPDEREGIPHHLIDIREPEHPFSVSEFQSLCAEKIAEIHSRGKLPFIVGGTGLYVESVCYGFRFQDTGSDEAFRAEMRLFAREQGAQALHDRLGAVDPVTSGKLHPNDEGRIIRALEVYHLTGKPLSESQDQSRGDDKQSPYRLCIIGLAMDRADLYARIDRRVDEMMEAGLVDEVNKLLGEGVPREAVSMRGLGYKEIVAYLAGETDYATAVDILKRDTRHFAKRQLSWFRHMKALEWVDVRDDGKNSDLFKRICAIIAGKFQIDIEYICS